MNLERRRITANLLLSYLELHGHNECCVCSEPMTAANLSWRHLEAIGPQKEWRLALGNLELGHSRCLRNSAGSVMVTKRS